MKAFLDTHAAVALAEGDVEILGAAARNLIERSALFVSPFVRLELSMLAEIKRLRVGPDRILDELAQNLGVAQSDDPVAAVVNHALTLQWTRDPLDRLLVATAALHRAPFITRDEKIHQNFAGAVW